MCNPGELGAIEMGMRVDSETGLVIHRGVLSRSIFAVRLVQLLNFVFGIAYAVFLVRFALEYVGARRNTGFFHFIEQVTNPLYQPFENIVRTGRDGAGHPLVWSLLVAVAAIALLHAALVGLVRVLARPHVVVDDDD